MTGIPPGLGLTPSESRPAGFDPADVEPRATGDEPLPLLSVALDVSGRCNLACRYCAESAMQPRRRPMPSSVLTAALALLPRAPPPGLRPTLRLGSGEPLLGLPLLRELHSSLAGRAVDVFLTTNGVLVDDAVADWLAGTGWSVKISCDGPAVVHDAWRCGPGGAPTHDAVSAAIRRMVRRCPERVSAAAVLCRGADPAAVFGAIGELGVRRIELLPVAARAGEAGRASRPSAGDIAAYVRFVDAHARAIARDGPRSVPTLARFAECVHRVLGYGAAVAPCGAGRGFAAVGAEGDLYPCFRFAGIDAFRVGSVGAGIDAARAAEFRVGAGRTVRRRSPCDRCWASSLCGGPCFAVAELLGDGDGAPDPLHCAYRLADARAAVRLVTALRADAPERLLELLPRPVRLE